MFYKKYLYPFLAFVAFGLGMTSCQDDPIEANGTEKPDSKNDNDAIEVVITLDAMGGEGDVVFAGNTDPFDIEDYIDPEKIRIFFFDNEEKFLFESQSRWVKQLESSGNIKSWLVSIPFYTGANDADEFDWDWEGIREKLTSDKFKIVVVCNQPKTECYPDLAKAEEERNPNNYFTFNNDGPHWNKFDTGVKKIFDLHHTQWYPIYTEKGMRGSTGQFEGFYEYIMGTSDDPDKQTYKQRLLMSATSCWVNYGPNLDDQGEKFPVLGGSGASRFWKKPNKEYPIPMYGVQEFDKITNWSRGTPFNLSAVTSGSSSKYNRKNIPLLRSVVKLELLISTNYTKPEYVSVEYPNVYARIEPMDCWSTTEEIWDDSHDNCKEWEYIMRYGALAHIGDVAGSKTDGTVVNDRASFNEYRQRLSWFYGCWTELDREGKPRWTFPGRGTNEDFNVNCKVPVTNDPYPRIFNPVIQRNTRAIAYANVNGATKFTELDASDSYKDGYYHFIVYCGEKNVNDPSDLFNLEGDGEGGSGKTPAISWVFNIGSKAYSVPIRDYSIGGAPSQYISWTGDTFSAKTASTGYKTVRDYVSGEVMNSEITYKYQELIYANPKNTDILPWPLIRNHVYRVVIGAPGSPTPKPGLKRVPAGEELNVTSSVSSSRSLTVE